MAMLLKNRFELLTMRCWFRTKPVTSADSHTVMQVVVTRLYRGEMPLSEEVETDAVVLGLDVGSTANLSNDVSLGDTPMLPQLVQAKLLSDDRVLWFHISSDSLPLATIPWERLVRDATDLTLIRIPNFFENAYRPSREPTVVLCASAPIGDGPYALPQYVVDALDALDAAASASDAQVTVHLFVDLEVHSEILGRVDLLRPKLANLRLRAPPIPPLGGERSSRAETGSLRSPWLQWISDELRDEPADLVHFISPGHFNGERGAIVLAGRPDANRRHGDVIGAAELATFYDQLGCSAMAFSSPDMPQWVKGQRVLAFELSWLRPGPLMLTEGSLAVEAAVPHVLRALLGGEDDLKRGLTHNAPLHLCLHPELVSGTGPAPAETGRGDRPKTEQISESYVRILEASLSETRDLAPQERWEKSGAREALNFLSDLVGRRERF